MKKTYFVLATLLLAPTIALAGMRIPNLVEATVLNTGGECYIGKIATSYNVSDDKIDFYASIYIIDSGRDPVSGAEVHGAWRDKKGIVTDGKCTTGDDGKCSIPHIVRTNITKKVTDLPQRGIRIIGVTCPGLKYTYTENSTFAWATHD